MSQLHATCPTSIDDPINRQILAVSEDKIAGFVSDPFATVADLAELDADTVRARIAGMLRAGVIRRVRQTLMTTSLAPGALVAWVVPNDRLHETFDWMFQQDPFSGHVVIRTADPASPGAAYRLWTTLKVPQGFDMDRHCRLLMQKTGAEAYRLMPAKKLFALGVGHVRRRELAIGERTEAPGRVLDTQIIHLEPEQWRVLMAMKREFQPEEIIPDPWAPRADEVGMPRERFLEIGEALNAKQVIGRFSTFLEHVKKQEDGTQVTRYNALFHWRVPPGQEMAAGREVGRHVIMTHAYWREAGAEFRHVNVMGVAHGLDKDKLLAHKAAIDAHLEEAGIPVEYTNVFWGGRSEIKPSEISPIAYEAWCRQQGIDPEAMRSPE